MDEEVQTRGVLAIGGSAGAVPPLRMLLEGLGPHLRQPVIVLLHMPANGMGILATVSAASPHLPVQEVIEGAVPEPGHVYVASPDRHLLVVDGKFRLGNGPRENLARPAIDPLLRSIAMSYGPRAVAVLLSGMLDDGVSGLDAIKRCGGVAVVQDPADALVPGMPAAAVAKVKALDLVARADALPALLQDLLDEPAGWPVPVPDDIRLEVQIAAGDIGNTKELGPYASPSSMTCPSCGGVMSEMTGQVPLRYRCQVGHAMTAEVMASQQEGAIDEAIRIALRVIEERAQLVARMADESRAAGRTATTESYEQRAEEYRRYAETLRVAVLSSLKKPEEREPESG
jgi:two-component system, chemotaxis family, protein-glutamate methylesterase/glutaminase